MGRQTTVSFVILPMLAACSAQSPVTSHPFVDILGKSKQEAIASFKSLGFEMKPTGLLYIGDKNDINTFISIDLKGDPVTSLSTPSGRFKSVFPITASHGQRVDQSNLYLLSGKKDAVFVDGGDKGLSAFGLYAVPMNIAEKPSRVSLSTKVLEELFASGGSSLRQRFGELAKASAGSMLVLTFGGGTNKLESISVSLARDGKLESINFRFEPGSKGTVQQVSKWTGIALVAGKTTSDGKGKMTEVTSGSLSGVLDVFANVTTLSLRPKAKSGK